VTGRLVRQRHESLSFNQHHDASLMDIARGGSRDKHVGTKTCQYAGPSLCPAGCLSADDFDSYGHIEASTSNTQEERFFQATAVRVTEVHLTDTQRQP
jgi:hypothetical protein